MSVSVPLWPLKKNIKKAQDYIIETKAFGFYDGGCRIFAEAIKFIIPTCEIVTILRKKQPDHYGVYLPEFKLWGDASGLYENQYLWAQKFSYLEHVPGKLVVVKDYIDTDSVPKDFKLSQKISEILSK